MRVVFRVPNFTAFHGLSLQKKGVHANFTVFSRFSLVDFPLLSP